MNLGISYFLLTYAIIAFIGVFLQSQRFAKGRAAARPVEAACGRNELEQLVIRRHDQLTNSTLRSTAEPPHKIVPSEHEEPHDTPKPKAGTPQTKAREAKSQLMAPRTEEK